MAGIVVAFVIFGVVVLLLVVGGGALLIGTIRERRTWRAPGLSPAEQRPGSEWQEPAGSVVAPDDEGALAAWNLAQFKTHQAGDGGGIPPF